MYENNNTKIDELRERVQDLKKELEAVTMERGLAAEDNKDLRENSTFDYWDQKERNLIIRIHRLLKEISDLAKKNKTPIKLNRVGGKKEKKTFEFKPHKWI